MLWIFCAYPAGQQENLETRSALSGSRLGFRDRRDSENKGAHLRHCDKLGRIAGTVKMLYNGVLAGWRRTHRMLASPLLISPQPKRLFDVDVLTDGKSKSAAVYEPSP